jgi:hypothetical protein
VQKKFDNLLVIPPPLDSCFNYNIVPMNSRLVSFTENYKKEITKHYRGYNPKEVYEDVWEIDIKQYYGKPALRHILAPHEQPYIIDNDAIIGIKIVKVEIAWFYIEDPRGWKLPMRWSTNRSLIDNISIEKGVIKTQMFYTGKTMLGWEY